MRSNIVYFESKPRYEILDGLRGVAAMLVVMYHLLETYFGGSPHQPINHGCQAIALAYATFKFYDLPVREWLKRKWFAPAKS